MNWQLLHPEALAFLLIAPVLLLLHLARRKPVLFPTPFLKIWERAQPRRGGGFKRLQDLLALLIALALLVLITAAILRPWLPPPEPEHILILFDDSASMSAVDRDGTTRIEKAKEKLAHAVRTSPPHVRFALATLAPGPVLLLPFSSDRSRVLEAVEKLQFKPMPARTESGLRDLAPLVIGKTGQRFWLISDDLRKDPPSEYSSPVPVDTLPCGDRPDNVRIVSLSGAWGGWWDPDAMFFVKVENTGPEPAQVRVLVHGGGETHFSEELTLVPGTPFESTFPVKRMTSEVMVSAELVPGGALALDDRAWCRLPGREKRRILLATEAPSAFVQSAIEGLEELMDKERSGIVPPSAWRREAAPRDIVVFEGTGPGDAFPEGGAVVIGAPASHLPGAGSSRPAEGASVTEWDRKHPVTRGLSFDNVFFHEATPLPESYAPLVMTDRGAVIGARESDGTRAVVLSFSLRKTNLGLVSSFPILIRNAIRWVGGEAEPGSCPGLEPGCGKIPPGYLVKWVAGREDGPGVAQVLRNGKRYNVAVNFLDRDESTLSAPAREGADGLTVPEARRPGSDPWRWFLWIALALAALDWVMLFFRRR